MGLEEIHRSVYVYKSIRIWGNFQIPSLQVLFEKQYVICLNQELCLRFKLGACKWLSMPE
jgi:hypothetical protein